MPGSELDLVPVGRARVLVDASGTLGAVQEASLISIVSVLEGTTLAQIDLDPGALEVEAGWLGAPARLLLITRYARETTAQVFDPRELRAVSELWFGSQLRLLATTGNHAVVLGERIAVFELRGDTLVAEPLAVTASLAGPAGDDQIALVVDDSIELWDLATRQRTRSVALAAPIASLGGNARCVWAAMRLEPSVIAVVSHDAHQRRRIGFPEPIRGVASDARLDVVAGIGASGRLYVARLDGSEPVSVVDTGRNQRIDAAAFVVGARRGLLIAQAYRPIAFVELELPSCAPAPTANDLQLGRSVLAPIHATVETAKLLGGRTDLSPPLLAVIAVVDAMERGDWPAMPFEQLLGETAPDEREELRAALVTLTEGGVVVHGRDGMKLDPAARRTLAYEPASVTEPIASEGLGALIAPAGAAVVLVGGDPARRLRALRAATSRSVGLVASAAPLAELRELWLRGGIAMIETEGIAELGVLEQLSPVPSRLVIGVDSARAGEAIARLHRRRPAALYRIPPERTSRRRVPAALESLVSTMWNGMRIPEPAVRVAGLRGTPKAVAAAAHAIAEAHGVGLHHVDGLVAARDALATGAPVVLIDRTAELDALAAYVLAAMIERTEGIVLIGDPDAMPAPIARVIPTVLDVAATAGSAITRRADR